MVVVSHLDLSLIVVRAPAIRRATPSTPPRLALASSSSSPLKRARTWAPRARFVRVAVRDPHAAAAAAAATGFNSTLGAERAARRRTWVSPPATGGRHFWEHRAEWSAAVAGEAAEAALPPPRAGSAGGDVNGSDSGDAPLRRSWASATSFASLASARGSVIDDDVDAAAADEEEDDDEKEGGSGAAAAAGGACGGAGAGGAVFDGVPLRSIVRLELCRHSRTRGEVIVLRKFSLSRGGDSLRRSFRNRATGLVLSGDRL
jgi:hypothetical protein